MKMKPKRMFLVEVISNGAIIVRELTDAEVPRRLPHLGEPGFDPKIMAHVMMNSAELGFRISQTVDALAIMDAEEPLEVQNDQKDFLIKSLLKPLALRQE